MKPPGPPPVIILSAFALELLVEGLADDPFLGEGLPGQKDGEQEAQEYGGLTVFSHDSSPLIP